MSALPPSDEPPDLVEQSRKLAQLRDAGVLTEEEFQQARRAALTPLRPGGGTASGSDPSRA
jgi:hypothetical protein